MDAGSSLGLDPARIRDPASAIGYVGNSRLALRCRGLGSGRDPCVRRPDAGGIGPRYGAADRRVARSCGLGPIRFSRGDFIALGGANRGGDGSGRHCHALMDEPVAV